MRHRITPEEFADGCARVDGIAKHLVPAGSMVLRMIVLPMLMVLAGGALMGIGATICDDETPKDYWRDECVEMGENCATRSLPPLESLYPTCRAVCNATLSPAALAETTSPGCPAGDLGCPHEGGLAGLPCLPCPVGRVGEGDEPTRGCHCQPSSDVRRISCQIKKGKGRFVPGCREFEYTRVCDDVMHPLFLLGTVTLVLGYIGIFGYWFYVICFKAPALVRQAMHLFASDHFVFCSRSQKHRRCSQNKKLEALCQTLTRESRTGSRWDYIAFTQGSGKQKKYYKSVVVQSSGAGQPMVVATPARRATATAALRLFMRLFPVHRPMAVAG